MRLTLPQTDRRRRTDAVIELLRRRAELRRARGEPVPPALRQTIDEYDRHARAHHAGPR